MQKVFPVAVAPGKLPCKLQRLMKRILPEACHFEGAAWCGVAWVQAVMRSCAGAGVPGAAEDARGGRGPDAGCAWG